MNDAGAGFDSIEVWRKGLIDQWGGDPLGEEPAKLETVKNFCEFIGKTPDELVAFCFLRKKATGQRFASTKRREAVAEQLKAFRQERGLTALQGRKASADVLSFLVHNGVMIHMGMV